MAIVSCKLLPPLLLPLLLLAALSEEAAIKTSSVFDVQSSIQKTLNVFSPDSQKVAEESHGDDDPQRHPSSSSFSALYSFPLHSRLAFKRPRESDYESLMKARLKRDSARVQSLQARLDLAVNGGEMAEIQEDEAAAVTISFDPTTHEYLAKLQIGSPPQDVLMAVDTGSELSWMQCHQGSVFDPSSSTTYVPVQCNAPLCKSLEKQNCDGGTCGYQLTYGDGSGTSGKLATETVHYGGNQQLQNMTLGCGGDTEGPFARSSGVMGLGRGALSFTSQINASSLSYCLVDPDSTSGSTLEFNIRIPDKSIRAPLLPNPTPNTGYFYANLTGISVGNKNVIAVSGGAVVDTGTVLTRFQRDVYISLQNDFIVSMMQNGMGDRKVGGSPPFDTCYNMMDLSKANVSTVFFHFSNGNRLPLPPENFLVAVDSQGTHCFAFAISPGSMSIIGNVQQRGMRVTYDLDSSQICFTADNC
ncbi:unnamed protein product [Cuscuta europaea]|uniref:Peptidase A1 domain-containing protein n=1 Tax=Cuscuta europaea TaxID=41803 RepID=A0A9P0ZHM1_CUSEU|nr:unnamed protein product [Cuscuta europaea]